MSISHAIVHDLRLTGCVAPRTGQRVIRTSQSTPLDTVARIIRSFAWDVQNHPRVCGLVPVPVLSLMAHGVRVENDQAGRDRALEIGRDYIRSDNAEAFGRSIRGCISEKIRVLGCNAAGSEDGKRMCSALAVGAGVRLYASSVVQDYTTYTAEDGWGRVTRTWLSFGAWEGEVFVFNPDGTHRLAWRGPDPVSCSSCQGNGSGTESRPPVCPDDWRVTTAY